MHDRGVLLKIKQALPALREQEYKAGDYVLTQERQVRK